MATTDLTIRPIIGMEIHVQLATRTKMFCRCPVEFAAEPNSRTCPVCLGLPGALPVMNGRAVEFAVQAGLALGCTVSRFSKWDRKSYFYPDMPKNYQISQYDLPLSHDGTFEFALDDGSPRNVGIIRAHLEEDAGKNLHEGLDHTRIDLNRAGTPLLEIVTQPDLASADESAAFCIELQRLVRFLGISEANMQKGQMRFEPNVNVAITSKGREYRTPISEIKNLNSFRSVRLAVEYEIKRQVSEWQADNDYTLERVGKQNYGWDDGREVTEFQRGKEESHDYRYFPDPDLVPVKLDDATLARLKSDVGELPLARQRRFMSEYGMSAKDCEVILADRETAKLYDEAIEQGAEARMLTKQFVGIWNHLASAKEQSIGRLKLSAPAFAELAKIVTGGSISATAAMQVAEKIVMQGAGGPLEIAKELGVLQERDEGATMTWVEQAFADNPQAVAGCARLKRKEIQGRTGLSSRLCDEDIAGQGRPETGRRVH